MVIVASFKDITILNTLKDVIEGVKLIPSDISSEPIVYATEKDDKPFGVGMELAKTVMKYGYNRITKFCPLLKKTCIGEKCSFYFVDGGTGDCSMIWQLFRGK